MANSSGSVLDCQNVVTSPSRLNPRRSNGGGKPEVHDYGGS